MTPQPVTYVVDDDASSLESTCWLLDTAGITVQPFPSAEEFLEQLSPEQPGCLVTDLRMPKMSGLDLVQRVREIDCPLATIVITAFADVTSCKRALKLGVLDFLEKPVNPEEFIEKVRDGLVRCEGDCLAQRERKDLNQRLETLTARELEVAKGLFQGRDMKQIAVDLDISHQTVARHRAGVLEKLAVSTDAELALLLMRVYGAIRPMPGMS